MKDAFENPIEMGQGLEPHLVGDFADAQVGIQEQFLGFSVRNRDTYSVNDTPVWRLNNLQK